MHEDDNGKLRLERFTQRVLINLKMSQLALSDSFEDPCMGVLPLEIFVLLQRGDRLLSSESDVYRRQILMTKVDPRAVRVNS